MEYQGIALSLEPFTTEPCPEFFCSHLIKLNALLMSFSQTEHPKAAVRTALLGSLLPLAGELPAAAQALRPWWDRARGTRTRVQARALWQCPPATGVPC